MNKTTLVEPKKLKGFNDFFADDVRLREYVINTFKKGFEKYGYEPLETPSVELTEMMVGISGSEAEKQFYRFSDPGGRDVMLKYEVMTSMCRAVGENFNNIAFPYKRYQIQKVWRAENVQKGRYREFTQCDADTIGGSSLFYDAEFIQMGLEIVDTFGFEKYVARISNRKFMEGLAEFLGIEKDKIYGYFMSIDKLAKIGVDGVKDELINGREIDPEKVDRTFEILDQGKFAGMSFMQVIQELMKTVGTTAIGKEGLDELAEVVKYLEMGKVDPAKYAFDVSLARGLASYTGPVWEFEVKDGGVGSIAGCGRYDKLIEKYIGRSIEATGGSFGIERMTDILRDRGLFTVEAASADVMVTTFSEELLGKSLEVAQELRKAGLRTMLYPEAIGIGKQLKFADRKKIQNVIIVGPDEIEKGVIQLKDLKESKIENLPIKDVINRLLRR